MRPAANRQRHAPREEPGDPERSSSRVRTWSRLLCLVIAVACLGGVSSWPAIARAVPALSPFVAFSSLLATRMLSWSIGLGLAVGLVVIFRRRWFCRWVCPTGLCIDGASRVALSWGRTCPHWPSLGIAMALVTIGGACLGYPLLLWLDPLALLAGAFGWPSSGAPWARYLAASGLAAVLVFSLIWPRVWCVRLCPLGGLQDFLARSAAWCRSAGAPARGAGTTAAAGWRLPRRSLLAGMVGALWAVGTRRVRADRARPLRPPGAVPEDSFTGLCIRCGSCVRTCPTKIIEVDAGRHGVASLFAPVVRFRQDYCLETCVRCTEVCPSGALSPLALADKLKLPLGLPQVDMNVCLLADDEECSACRSHCPYDAVTYPFSRETYTLRPVIDPAKCPGCGACEVACPTQPIKAIVVRPLSQVATR